MPYAPFSSSAERHLLTLLAASYDEREMECILERFSVRSEAPLLPPRAPSPAGKESAEDTVGAGRGHAGVHQHSLFEEV